MTVPVEPRPAWRVGQVLLPEHFLGLEAALGSEAALRASALGVPSHGLVRLEWNGDGPANGVLWVDGLTAVLPEGAVVDLPGNARLKAPLDLKAAGRREVEVYAHVLGPEPPGDETAIDPPAPGDIPRAFLQLELSTEPSVRGARGRIPLGLFRIGVEGGFRLADRAFPPILRLDTTPYFGPRLSRLRGELSVFEQTLDELAVDMVARGESLGPVQRVRLEVRKLVAMLGDIERGAPLHPYTVFAALRAFSLDLYLLEERASPWQPPAYAHDDPAACFGAVLAEIAGRVQIAPSSSPSAIFVPDNGRLVAADLPAEALSAPEVYVAVLKARAADRVSLEGARFASPTRLRIVREHALRGVRLTPVPAAPFRHGFGGAVDFYRLTVGAPGDDAGEWAYVVRERALAFLPPPELEGQKVVVCWRRP